VSDAVIDILNRRPLPDSLNHTHVALIPKVKTPKSVTDFRPISLCNFLYKLVTKVFANRLKPLLPEIISDVQSAFVKGRLISDNILIAYEVFHHMHYHSGANGDMAIKLDMHKAFNRVEWNYLGQATLRLGLCPTWVDTIMRLVETAIFSFIINGEPKGFLKPSRGIR